MVLSLDVLAGLTPNGTIDQTLEQTSVLEEQTNRILVEIIRQNLSTQYVTQAPSFSAFRDAVAAHGGTEVDSTFVAYFQTHVPLSDYSHYKPFMNRFDAKPCKREDVENLLAPGLPEFFTGSSSTTGVSIKCHPRYKSESAPARCPFFSPHRKNPLAAIAWCGFLDVKEIQDGQVVKKVPVCGGTGKMVRTLFGWEFDGDESRMPLNLPYYAVPWAGTNIIHVPSALTIFALFFLTNRDVDGFYVPFASRFVDFIRNIDEQWDTLISYIRDGIIPDLEDIDHVRGYLQTHFHPNPERAAELLEIGPPFSLEGWASRVWPKLTVLCTVCTGPWTLLLPRIKSILGPNITIRGPAYGAAESTIGIMHDMNKPEEYVLPNDKVTEFLDVTKDDSLEGLRQPWEVEVGKQYEIILTTKNGLWRYHLGDVVSILGFHPQLNSPIFKYFGRKSVKIQLPHTEIADFYLAEVLRVIGSEDTIIVEEFTTLLDDRMSPPALGFVVGLSKEPGSNAHLARQKLFDALVATDSEHQRAFQDGRIGLPTIRIVKPGTFFEYCCWRAKTLGGNAIQFKVPTVLADPTIKEWILEQVIQEL